MTLKALATAACITAFSAAASFAATFTVNGTNFDVETIEGSFNDNQALLESQIWFGNQSLAFDFAEVIQDAFASVNGNSDGAYFLFQPNPNNDLLLQSATFTTFFSPSGDLAVGSSALGGTNTYAIATIAPVPLPAGGLLLMSGIGGIAAFKRRKKRTA